MPTHTRTDPVGSKKVRTVRRQRSFECHGGVNLDKSVLKLRQNYVVTWEKRTFGTRSTLLKTPPCLIGHILELR
jgi:hypothetical protein